MNQIRYDIYKIIYRIYEKQEFSNLSLRQYLNKIANRQKPFVTQVVYGTVENQTYIRYCWESYSTTKPNIKLQAIIDMSVYQLLFMESEDAFAIVHEAVEISKQVTSIKQSKYVNAILRKVILNGKKDLPIDEWEALHIETSHPMWLIQMWKAQYGEERCKLICHENMKARRNVARVNTLKIAREELLQLEPNFHACALSEDGIYLKEGNFIGSKWFQEGYISIQDEASQMVAIHLDPKSNDKVLDVCSAPGTKACHMAQKMKDKGSILCLDLYQHRVKLIQQGAQKLNLTCIQTQQQDATNLNALENESFDKILCDVPCSGYGTLARKSDIKLKMNSCDMDSLIPLQYSILEEASKKLKINGYLVYSTCTLNKKENEKQIQKFLSHHNNYKLIQEKTFFPYEYECDGFYIAKLQKVK